MTKILSLLQFFTEVAYNSLRIPSFPRSEKSQSIPGLSPPWYNNKLKSLDNDSSQIITVHKYNYHIITLHKPTLDYRTYHISYYNVSKWRRLSTIINNTSNVAFRNDPKRKRNWNCHKDANLLLHCIPKFNSVINL